MDARGGGAEEEEVTRVRGRERKAAWLGRDGQGVRPYTSKIGASGEISSGSHLARTSSAARTA